MVFGHATAEFLRSSPGKLLAIGFALVVLSLTAAGAATKQASDQRTELTTVLGGSEPFLHSTEQLYNSLSTADAAAGTAFLYGEQEPQQVRDSYAQAVNEASADIAGVGEAGAEPGLRRGVAAQIPVYTGLVATARTEDRGGHPVGAAYLAEASHLMQYSMLPMAQDLHNHESAAVMGAQRRTDSPPWESITLLVLAVVALVFGQRHVARRSRRRLNSGLLSATGAMLVLCAWLTSAGTVSALSAQHALDRGTVPLAVLADSRILVQQARADETLKLVRHDTSTQYDEDFDKATHQLTTQLNAFPAGVPGAAQVSRARTALGQWLAAHHRMSDDVDAGDFHGAEVVAIGPGSDNATIHFQELDTALRDGLAVSRAELRGDVKDALSALDLLSSGSLLLGVASAVAIGIGLWPRLREYR